MTLFTRQHSVASMAQLRSLGVTRPSVTRACASGTLERVHRGVYRLGGSTPSFEGDALALQLFAGRTAFLSGPTAGVLHGLRDMPRRQVEVTVGEGSPGLPARAPSARADELDRRGARRRGA